MYNDDTNLKDIYDVIDGVRDDINSVHSNQVKIANKMDSIEETISSTTCAIERTIERNGSDLELKLNALIELTLNMLNEMRKTNILSKKNLKENLTLKIDKFDSKKHANRSLVIINDSFLTAKVYAQTLADNSGKKLFIVDTNVLGDMASILTNANVNDYVLIDYNSLLDSSKRFLQTALSDNYANFIVGKGTSMREVKMDLKPINYIIYSDLLEMIDVKLIEGLDVVG